MKGKNLINGISTTMIMACAAIGWMCLSVGNLCPAQPAANVSPGLLEVVKLSQAQMGDDVIITYIKNSGASYRLSADDILYLKSQNVSQTVISQLMQGNNPPPTSNPVPPPPV